MNAVSHIRDIKQKACLFFLLPFGKLRGIKNWRWSKLLLCRTLLMFYLLLYYYFISFSTTQLYALNSLQQSLWILKEVLKKNNNKKRMTLNLTGRVVKITCLYLLSVCSASTGRRRIKCSLFLSANKTLNSKGIKYKMRSRFGCWTKAQHGCPWRTLLSLRMVLLQCREESAVFFLAKWASLIFKLCYLVLTAQRSYVCPTPEVFKVRLNGKLGKLIKSLATLPIVGELELDGLSSPFHSKSFHGSMILFHSLLYWFLTNICCIKSWVDSHKTSHWYFYAVSFNFYGIIWFLCWHHN